MREPASDNGAERLRDILRGSERLMAMLTLARELAAPDWLVVSGAIYQTVWNHLTGRAPDYGIRDYDLIYFDPDSSYAAEDVFIRRAAALFPPPLDTLVEVRNQARVHLWFEAKFGEPYAPLSNSAESLERFVCPAFSVGVRLEADDQLHLEAPFGLEDLFAMRLRPNPLRPLATGWARTTSAAKARWPEVIVEEVD